MKLRGQPKRLPYSKPRRINLKLFIVLSWRASGQNFFPVSEKTL